MNICRGQCLTPTVNPATWCRDVTCKFHCEPVRCSNFAFCRELGAECWFDMWAGICLKCKITFGRKLDIIPTSTSACNFCLKRHRGIVYMPGCSHFFCFECFYKICNLGVQAPSIIKKLRIEPTRISRSMELPDSKEGEKYLDSIQLTQWDWSVRCPICAHVFISLTSNQ